MIKSYKGKRPTFGKDVKLMEGSHVIGDVVIGDGSSVWFNSIVRGDVNKIRIGKNTNVQDLTMIHCTLNLWPTHIGDGVTIGHRVMLHGCTIGNNVLVGMSSTILDGAKIGDNTIIGAGSLILEGKEFPPGVLIVGSPAKVKRELREDEIQLIEIFAQHYQEYAANYDESE